MVWNVASVTAGVRTPRIAGGEVVARLLAGEGVDHVFGIIDGTYFGFYSSLEPHGMDLVVPRHESSAVHMAGAYARLTGRLGVCMASNGPGVANALPGVAVEQAEGNRVLLITSSRRTGIVAPDRGGAFQCFPQIEAIAAMAKESCAVTSFDRLAEMTRRALRACFTGRPGVVHLDVPEDLMNGKVAVDPSWFRAPSRYRAVEPPSPSDGQIRELAKMLAQAERPIVHAGSGVIHAGAYDSLRELAELMQMPITTSWGARAVIDERDEHAIPMIYVDAVNRARNEADAVLVLGSRLGETDWWGKAPYWAPPARQRLAQVDLEAGTLGNNRPVDLAIQADVGVVLERLLEVARVSPTRSPKRRRFLASLRADCRARRAELDGKLAHRSAPMHPAHVATTCREVFDDDAILVYDGGNTAIWASFFHEVRRPNTALSTPKMGMLGAGVSQALAAQVAFPDRRVYCITGDGAMGFHPQEIETAVRNDLPVIYLVLCDRAWGMVKINQQFALKPVKTLLLKSLPEEETIHTDLGEIRFDDLARSMGAHGERVRDPARLRGALERALASGKPAVIHVDVDRVAHMWAPELKTFKDMHQEPKG